MRKIGSRAVFEALGDWFIIDYKVILFSVFFFSIVVTMKTGMAEGFGGGGGSLWADMFNFDYYPHPA